MPKLPHRREDVVGNKYYEPIYKSLFEARIQFPAAVDESQRELVLDNITKVSGLETEKMPAKVTQKFKGVTRTFAGSVIDDTSHEVTVTFNLNLDDSNTNYVYKLFRKWSDLIYNVSTGERGLAAEYMANTSLTVTVFNKKEQIFRTYKATDIFLSEAIPSLSDFDHVENGIWEDFEVKFTCDRIDVTDN